MDELEKRARELLAAELDERHPFDAGMIRQGHMPGRQIPALRAVIAALSAAPQVPEGWVPVPENPSAEMRSSGDREIRCCEGAAAVWYAMLAARPEPQA